MRLLILIFSLISLTAFGQKKNCDCNLYRTGHFYTLGPDNNSKDTLYITRTASEQTEVVGEDYSKKNKVIWLSPCKFLLRDSSNHTAKKYHPTDVIVQIIETFPDYYLVKAWAPGGKKMIMPIYVLK
jgi:hypothetical protein